MVGLELGLRVVITGLRDESKFGPPTETGPVLKLGGICVLFWTFERVGTVGKSCGLK